MKRPADPPTHSFDAALDAGLAAAFGKDDLTAGGWTRPPLLRDEPSDFSPIVRPDSNEMSRADPGRYQLFGEIARGGMGVILKGRDPDLGRDLAVKVLRTEFAGKAFAEQRFVEEAQVGGQLQHPGVVPVYELGKFKDGRPYFTMKLVKGRTLSALLADRVEPTAERGRFLKIFEGVAQTIAYAHSKGVIHRDIKPANVMVGNFGEVQVMDWGLAKVLPQGGIADEIKAQASRERKRPEEENEPTVIRTVRTGSGGSSSETEAGSMLGTPAYMPPEQAGGERDKLDERADVFGLGAVLCVILTGDPPYISDSPEAIRLMALRANLDDCWRRLDSCGADAELIALCKRCLAKEVADRPRNGGEVAKAIHDHLAAVEERANRAERDRAAAEVRTVEQQKRRRVQIALTASLLGFAFATVFGVSVASLWQRAARAKEIAETAHDEAVIARDELDREKEKLAVVEYGRAIQAAYQEWREHNVPAMALILESTRPDLRGWEWHLLNRFRHGQLLTLKGHTDAVWAASYSPDGARIVTASGDKTAKVWDAKTGRELLVLRGHTGRVVSASFSADGTRILTGSIDQTAKIWDAKSGEELQSLNGQAGPILPTSFSPNGSRVVTGSMDGTAKVWDAKTGKELFTLTGHTTFVVSASFSPDGSRILTMGDTDATVRVWDANNEKELISFKTDSIGSISASFSPDGSRILTVGSLDGVKAWDAKTGKALLTLNGHRHRIHRASYSRDGSRIVTAGFDATVKVWDAKTGTEELTLKGHTLQINSVSFSPDGTRIVTGSTDATARVWEAKPTSDMLTLNGHQGPVLTTSYNADASRVVTGSADKTARVWSSKSGTELFALNGHLAAVTSAGFSPNGLWIVTGADDGTLKVWDANRGTELRSWKGHTKSVNTVIFSRDDMRIVSAGDDGVVQIWDANTGAGVTALTADAKATSSAQFSPDGTRIVIACAHKTAKVVDSKSSELLLTLKGHTGEVQHAAFSPDGTRIVSCGFDRTAKVWDANTGDELMTLNGHTTFVFGVAFSPDGGRIVSCGFDRTAKVWDAKTGTELLTLKDYTDGVSTASFSPDGLKLLTGSLDGTAKIWDATPVIEK